MILEFQRAEDFGANLARNRFRAQATGARPSPDPAQIARGNPLVLAKFKTMQRVDVCIPTTDGRELVLSRYTRPEAEQRVLLEQLRLTLPQQPPPKITARQVRESTPESATV